MKKFLFALTIVISCIVFTPNVLAINWVPNDDTLNILTTDNAELSPLLYRGDSSTLNNYIIGNYNNIYFDVYLDNLKIDYISTLNYSSWSSFTSSNYYIIQYYLTNVLSDNPLLQINVYSLPINSNQLSLFDIFLGAKSNTSTLNNDSEIAFYFGGPKSSGLTSKTYSVNLNDLATDSATSIGSSRLFEVFCRNGSSVCSASYDSTNRNMNINLGSWLSSGNLFYYDTNYSDVSFKVQQFNNELPFNYYWFWYYRVNSGPRLSIGNEIGIFDTGFTIELPNIQDLGNNSYGLNLNTITNYTSSPDSSFTPIDITCPTDRQFVNNVCSIYNSDFSNYNKNFTNFYQQPFFYLGTQANFELDGSKYYILSLRLYSSYNFQPKAFVYHIGNSSTDFPVEDIYKVVVNDYSIYKDYQIVFKPSHNGVGYLKFFTIMFNNLSDNTSDLGEDYSFGIFKTIKISEYDNLPTDSEIDTDNNTNNLSIISNNDNGSFFSNFKLNDRGLSSFITLPLSYVNSLKNTSCSPISLSLPHLNNSATLPCLSSVFNDNVPTIWSLYKLIINGFLLYRIAISLFSSLKNIYNPNNDKIEVIDL